MLSRLKRKAKNKIWKILKDHFYYQRVEDSPVIQNINYDCNPYQKRAVLCYLTSSYFKNFESVRICRTQYFEILVIVKVFTEKGYSVDLIGNSDLKALNLIKDKEYNLIFGFGEAFYHLANQNPDSKTILYMTENTPEFSFKQEKERIDYYFERNKRKLKFTRTGKFYKDYHLKKKYSHVITMGEKELLKPLYKDPFFIYPTGLINHNVVPGNKDHTVSRQHFLWLGSTGALHKGLDILYDVFSKRDDIVLHICGLHREEKRILRIKAKSNIIDHGHIIINSGTFKEIVDTCSYIILPSCSEGFSTSVTTGMLHGLIPVVLKDTGFNMAGRNAIYLDSFKTEYINDRLNELSGIIPDDLKRFSMKVYDFARNNFTIEAFEANLRRILDEIA